MTKVYKFKYEGKTRYFFYDEEEAIVYHAYKLSKQELAEREPWMDKYTTVVDGYELMDGVGLRRENWKNKAVRDEYLAEYCWELDEEMECLMAMGI